MKHETFRQLIARKGMPDGFRPATAADLTEGAVVWVWGQKDDRPHAYGPHTYLGPYPIPGMVSLKNGKGRHFKDRPEHLIVKLA